MILTIDVGNTNMVFGLFSGEELAGTFRLRTSSDTTSDEIGILACEYFSRFGFEPSAVEDVVIASVVPQIMYTLSSAMIKYFDREPIVIANDADAGLRYGKGLENCTERLGADRAVTAVAAVEKYGAPLIVMDFGTATTIDALDTEGRYLGGTIGAGLRVSMDALIQGTAMLPRVSLDLPPHVIGTNTAEQIQAGVVAGYVGNMEYLITRMKQEIGERGVRVVATGGLCRLISGQTNMIDIVDGGLTLDGLRLIYQRRKQGATR